MEFDSTRVLLVEDDDDAAEEMAEALSNAGYPVTRVADGQDALSLLKSRPEIGVVVTDINMPRMDGLAFIESLRQLEQPGREWQVVFMSGEPRIEYPIKAIRHRPIEYLQKPVNATELCDAVQRAFAAARERARETCSRDGMLVSLNQMRALVNSLAANLGPAQDAAIPVPSITPRDPAKPRLNRPAVATDAEVDESKDVSDLAQRIKRLIRAQNSRSLFFDAALFSDPCWEMLLDLMSNHLLGREISVSSLCIASGVPQTTALRRIDDLAQANLIERVADPADRRRVYIRLKDDTVKKLDRYLQSFWSIASEAEPARRA